MRWTESISISFLTRLCLNWEYYITSFYIPPVNKKIVSFAYKEKVNRPLAIIWVSNNLQWGEDSVCNDAYICLRITHQAKSSNQNFHFLTYENLMHILRNWSPSELRRLYKNLIFPFFFLFFLKGSFQNNSKGLFHQ